MARHTPRDQQLARVAAWRGGGPIHVALGIDDVFAWLAERAPYLPPKSPMGKAIRYAQKQEAPLRQLLTDPKIALDNNAAERALKPVALGRKNARFAGHDEGAENLAKLQTVVATCQRHGVNPQAYLEDVLVRVHTHPANNVGALLPWSWRPPP
jgi:transposase